jgi:putative tryptophan/tyrosine transport system substrate-binding protein
MLQRIFKALTVLTFFRCAAVAKTIGIIQVIEHPALDTTRQGIIDTLKKNSPDLEITWRSAQGTMSTAVQLAQSFVGKKVDVIVAIGTMAAQAAVKGCEGTEIPVVFASVTDPESAGLVGKATGVSNFVDVDRQVQAFQKILPTFKKLGVIYNPGEAFSEKLLVLTRDVCQKRGITLECAVALKPTDVVSATQKLAGKVDAIFINNDNTALAAFPSIIQTADTTKTPVLCSDADTIKSGAVAVLGPDQYKIGSQTAEIISQLLKEEKTVKEIPIRYPDSVDLYLNREKLEQLGITPPDGGKEKSQ